MNTFKILGGVACLSLLLGTGAFAEIMGGEPGTSKNPKDNVPAEIQDDTPYQEDDASGSGPGERSDDLTGLKHEKPVKEGHEQLEKNVQETDEGAAAMAAEELEQKSREKSHKGISTQGAQ